jgi:tetratricopeptide (TPR) repeat protein
MLLALALACGSREERAESARARFEAASAAGDAVAAAKAAEDLRDALPPTPESALELARRLIRAGQTNRAAWLLEEELLRHPERADLKLALAEAALLVGDAARALAVLEKVGAGDPEHAPALLLGARAELNLGDLEGALATLERAEALYPNRLQLRLQRIEALVAEHRFEPALELVRQARLRDDISDEQRVWLERSEAGLLKWGRRVAVLIEHGRADEARDALDRALEARPDAGGLYALLASAHIARGDAEAAEEAMRERVERAPDVSAVYDLAEFLHRAGRSAEGAALLADGVEDDLGAGSVELAYLQVAMLLSSGDAAGAELQFEEFARRHPRDPRIEYLRAQFEVSRGDAEAAAERLKMLLPRLDRPDVQHWLALALEMLGDNEGAEYRYGLAVQRGGRRTAGWLSMPWRGHCSCVALPKRPSRCCASSPGATPSCWRRRSRSPRCCG